MLPLQVHSLHLIIISRGCLHMDCSLLQLWAIAVGSLACSTSVPFSCIAWSRITLILLMMPGLVQAFHHFLELILLELPLTLLSYKTNLLTFMYSGTVRSLQCATPVARTTGPAQAPTPVIALELDTQEGTAQYQVSQGLYSQTNCR
jgi:hypothetical protein